eukprot:g2587.t1
MGAAAAARGVPNVAFPDINFCKEPDAICTSTEHPELKWVAGLFYWINSVQTYDVGGWNYLKELKAWVDAGLPKLGSDSGFIHAVSGIVNRGCHNPPCGSGALDGGAARAKTSRLSRNYHVCTCSLQCVDFVSEALLIVSKAGKKTTSYDNFQNTIEAPCGPPPPRDACWRKRLSKN